ncbi:MAG: hypothetical protein M3Q45_03545 [Chloroflexota bacterium]|nr:hypothetical protein [Chloroflexota bacterium]
MKQTGKRLTLTVLMAALALTITLGAVSTTFAQTSGQVQGTDLGAAHRGGRGGWHGATLATLAETLNLSEADLRTALQAGQSVADVAAEQGVELDVVIATIVAEQTTNLAEAVTAGKLTQEEADARIAQLSENLPELLNLKGGQNGLGLGRQGDRGFSKHSVAALATVAATLDLTAAELLTALQAGQSVADVATAQGVALDGVVAAIVAEQSAWLAQAVTNGRITQAQADERLATLQAALPEQLARKGLPAKMGPGFGPGCHKDGLHAPQTPAEPAPESTPQTNTAPVVPEDVGNA